MKITEIYEPILEVLSTKRFVNHFEVAIYRPGMKDIIKIKGYKPNESSFPYDFSCELRNKINEVCYKIVSGALVDGDFTFDIKGQITYLYVHGHGDEEK